MKFTTLALALLLSLPVHFLFGQTDDFSLKDYKYPDLKRDALNAYFDFNNRLSNAEISRTGEDPEKEKNTTIGLDLDLIYTQYRQSRTWQRSIYGQLLNDMDNLGRVADTDSLNKEFRFHTDVYISSVNRRYFDKQFFVEGNALAGFDYRKSNEEYTNVAEVAKAQSWRTELELGVGKGRLEWLQDAQTAMYIMRDLEKYGLINQSLSAADYKALADVIAVGRNERFFDGRHKRIFQLAQVDSVLQATGVLSADNATAFTLINDNLFFANMPARWSGSRISVGGIVGIAGGKNEIDAPILSYDNNSRELTTGAYAEYRLEIPTSLFIQHSLRAEARFLKTTDEFGDHFEIEEDGNSFVGELYYGLGIYPNTRTSFTVYAIFDASWSKRERMQDIYEFNQKSLLLVPKVGANMYYYVSPQFRLSGSYQLSRGTSEIESVNFSSAIFETMNKQLTSRFHFGLDYFFF